MIYPTVLKADLATFLRDTVVLLVAKATAATFSSWAGVRTGLMSCTRGRVPAGGQLRLRHPGGLRANGRAIEFSGANRLAKLATFFD